MSHQSNCGREGGDLASGEGSRIVSKLDFSSSRLARLTVAAMACALAAFRVNANPQNGVAAQGTAKVTTSGNTLTVQTSDRAYINWSSFDIGVGETTTFVQPSSSSIVWNQINSPGAS